MRIVVIYGFLGNGKTTLINYLLSHTLAHQKVVVLENESGKESIDGDILRSAGYQVVDLVSGCVCCTLRSDLVDAIKQIEQKIAPDLLIIEPSGLAALDDLLKINGLHFDATITLIDASRYDLFMYMNRSYFERQYRLSPVFLITKTDLVEEDKLREIKIQLTTLNPRSLIFADLESLNVAIEENLIFEQCRKFTTFLFDSTTSKAHFVIEDFPLEKPQLTSNVEALFEALKPVNSKLVRAKGLLKIYNQETGVYAIYKLDYTDSQLNLALVPNAVSTQKLGLVFWWYEELPKTTSTFINKYLTL